jgi:hypothetical protein
LKRRASRHALAVIAAALTALLAACNALTGLDEDFRLRPAEVDAGDAGADAEADRSIPPVDAAPDQGEADAPEPVDGGCWADATLVPDDWSDMLWSPVPQPRMASGVKHRASYDASVPGEVYDEITRLTWLIDDPSSPSATRAEAAADCAARGARLPERMELVSIQNWLPADGAPHGADPEFFPDTVQSYYWTRTRNPANVKFYWAALFYDSGFAATPSVDESTAWQYRCVRGPGPKEGGAPPHRYEVSVQCGIVRDVHTRLEWERGKGFEGSLTQAEAHCLLLGHATGLTKWRLPTYSELQSILYTDRENPMIDKRAFDTGGAIYWSSTGPARNTRNRICIDFATGDSTNAIRGVDQMNVWGRCVRDMD